MLNTNTDRIDSTVRVVVAAVAGWVGGLSVMMKLLLFAMFVDIMSGLVRAFIEGKLDSSISRRGIGRKGLILLVVSGAEVASGMIGFHVSLPPFGELSLGAAMAAFYTISETMSIIENTSPYIPYPPIILDRFTRTAKQVGLLSEERDKGVA